MNQARMPKDLQEPPIKRTKLASDPHPDLGQSSTESGADKQASASNTKPQASTSIYQERMPKDLQEPPAKRTKLATDPHPDFQQSSTASDGDQQASTSNIKPQASTSNTKPKASISNTKSQTSKSYTKPQATNTISGRSPGTRTTTSTSGPGESVLLITAYFLL